MQAKSEVYKNGRITIPVQIRKTLNIQEGDEIIFVYSNGELKLKTQKIALDRAKMLLKKELAGEPVDFVEELLNERKNDFITENNE